MISQCRILLQDEAFHKNKSANQTMNIAGKWVIENFHKSLFRILNTVYRVRRWEMHAQVKKMCLQHFYIPIVDLAVENHDD